MSKRDNKHYCKYCDTIIHTEIIFNGTKIYASVPQREFDKHLFNCKILNREERLKKLLSNEKL